MSLSAEARARLATEQAELVAALLGRSEPPADFDAARLSATAAALAHKRARAAARVWPGMTQALGRRFGGLFAAYAAQASLPHAGGPLADGRAFARWLAAHGELPEAGQSQAWAVDLRYVSNPAGLAPRRGPACKAAWLHEPRRLLLGVWLPWLGEYRLTIPLGRCRQHKMPS